LKSSHKNSVHFSATPVADTCTQNGGDATIHGGRAHNGLNKLSGFRTKTTKRLNTKRDKLSVGGGGGGGGGGRGQYLADLRHSVLQRTGEVLDEAALL
jgi:hypothetical protein